MSVETKALPASTRTNLEALKHHMKKLGLSITKKERMGNFWGSSYDKRRRSGSPRLYLH